MQIQTGTSTSGDGLDDPTQAVVCGFAIPDGCAFGGRFALPGMEIGSLTLTITDPALVGELPALQNDLDVTFFASRLNDETSALLDAVIFGVPDPAQVVPVPPPLLMLAGGLAGLTLAARRHRVAYPTCPRDSLRPGLSRGLGAACPSCPGPTGSAARRHARFCPIMARRQSDVTFYLRKRHLFLYSAIVHRT